MAVQNPGGGGLLVVLSAAGRRCALAAREVVEVLAALPLHPLALAPASVAGVFDHHGQLVPVVDLTQLFEGRASKPQLASRIVVVHIGPRRIGLLADTCQVQPRGEAALQTGLHRSDAAFLGPVLRDEDGWLEIIDPAQLLSAELLESLLGMAEAARERP